MYPVGSLLVSAGTAFCRVREIAPRPGNGAAPERLYYTLKPLYTTETIIIPVDTKVALRPVLTRGEAEELVRSIPSIETESIRITSLPPCPLLPGRLPDLRLCGAPAAHQEHP